MQIEKLRKWYIKNLRKWPVSKGVFKVIAKIIKFHSHQFLLNTRNFCIKDSFLILALQIPVLSQSGK
jgi:hypothetical protein